MRIFSTPFPIFITTFDLFILNSSLLVQVEFNKLYNIILMLKK